MHHDPVRGTAARARRAPRRPPRLAVIVLASLLAAPLACAGAVEDDAGAAVTAEAPAAGAGTGARAGILERGRALVGRLRGASAGDAAADAAPIAPELTGVLADGAPFDLRSWRGAPVVLIFFRGEDCGLCLERLRELDGYLEAYRRRGARVAAVFPGDAEGAARVARETGARADIVAVEREHLESWGVWPPEERAARPAAAIVDPRGRIVFSHVGTHANDRVPDVDLLAELTRLAASGTGSAH